MANINPRVYVKPPFAANNFNVIQWADFPDNLTINPLTGDLVRVINNDAIKISLENIVQTYAYERPYSSLGTELQLRLFENSNALEIQLIKSSVTLAIQQYEKRVNLTNMIINVSEDQNYYTLTIYYTIINNPTVQNISIILQRVR